MISSLKKHIYNNSLKAIELCTLKLLDDWFPLLDLLAIILNPQCKYVSSCNIELTLFVYNNRDAYFIFSYLYVIDIT